MTSSDGVHAIIARRRRERDALLDTARRFADAIDAAIGIRSVVVFGSVARGDFNVWSDIDVLVVAERLPERPQDRAAAVGYAPGVTAVCWTPDETRRQAASRNPIACEAVERGVLVAGDPLDAVLQE